MPDQRGALDAARKDVARLRELLRKWGEHKAKCMLYDRAAWQTAGLPVPIPCTCGWAAVERELAGEESTAPEEEKPISDVEQRERWARADHNDFA